MADMITAYVGGLLVAGLLAGLLRPLSRFPLGAIGLGIIDAFFAYSAVGLAVDGLVQLREAVTMCAIPGILAGPLAGLILYVDPPWRNLPRRAGKRALQLTGSRAT